MADDENGNGNGNGDGNGDDDATVADRIRKLREKVNRREKAKRAKRRAKSRRVEKGDPKTQTESARVTKRRTEEAVSEAKQLSEDAKTLIATELGVGEGDAAGIIKEGADIVESRSSGGDGGSGSGGGGLGALDFDGDGDTDILTAIDEPGFDGGRRQQYGPRRPRRARGGFDPIEGEAAMLGNPDVDPNDVVDPTGPVMDLGEMTEPALDDFDVEDPIEEEIFSL